MRRRPEYDMKLIGKNLRRLRKRKNLSVDEVREYLCLGSVQAVYKYENGKNLPPADTMFALMELYGASVYDITRRHEDWGYEFSFPFGSLERVSFEQARKRQLERLVGYRKLYMELAG